MSDARPRAATCSLLALIVAAGGGVPAAAGLPAPAQYFTEQRVDHFSASPAVWTQRYYRNLTSWGGPGHPLLVILGGESAIEPSTGILYPWVPLELAPRFRAAVLQPEHRMYGASMPYGPVPGSPADPAHLYALTPQQALADFANFILSVGASLGCGPPGTPTYCPVVTFGGSYPGFLSAMLRLRYPAVVDMALAASAPLHWYTRRPPDEYAYYSLVTRVAGAASPGCPAALRGSLSQLAAASSKEAIVEAMGLCEPLPAYLAAGTAAQLVAALNMVAMYTFATLNMAAYPPPGASLKAACDALVASHGSLSGLKSFFLSYAQAPAAASRTCLDLAAQLADGPNATISAGDFTGVGFGAGGRSWDFETCTMLTALIGSNGQSDMFLPRAATLDWQNAHCTSRFGVRPQVHRLAGLWGLDRLVEVGASHIVFSNGLRDGWSVGSVQEDLSDTMPAVNMPTGAHHSDLAHDVPSAADTPDVVAGRNLIAAYFHKWLAARFPGTVPPLEQVVV